jgi:dihydrolipoamide dehydrogenase
MGGRIAIGSDKSTEQKDLVIIGGGVAGYVAAIKGAQEGLKVRHSPA